ncbi:hypothetical protein [Microbacterium xylanilyticum]
MLIGTIRPDESRTITVQGEELDEIQALVAAQTPAGWEIISAPVAMAKKDTILTAEATIARRDGLQEIEGVDLEDIRTRVPVGFKLIAVRAA